MEKVERALAPTVLAYCLMDTHIHVVVEGSPAYAPDALQAAMVAYTRLQNRHRGRATRALRGHVEFTRKVDACELARAIRYVHDNPLKTQAPLSPIEHPFSSQRAFSGLSYHGLAAVPRALALVGPHARWAAGDPPPPLADLEPVPVPTVRPPLILAAAAQTYGLPTSHLPGPGRSPALCAARGVFVRLGVLEAYDREQLAPFLGRSRSQTSRLAEFAPDQAVRMARTLIRDPGLCRRLLRSVPQASPSDARQPCI